MTATTFYASSPVAGIPFGNSDATKIVPILTIRNPSSNTVPITIQKLYWTYIGGILGRCSLIWIESLDNSSVVGHFVTGNFGDNVNIVTFDETISSSCQVTLNNPVDNFSLIRPSTIILSNNSNIAMEAVNGELIVLPGHMISVGTIGALGSADKSMLTLIWEESPSGPIPQSGSLVQNQQLIGVQNSVNIIFNTIAKFLFNGIYRPELFVNGVRQEIPVDYLVAEGGGPGTGFDTIIFSDPPFDTDDLTIDYFMV